MVDIQENYKYNKKRKLKEKDVNYDKRNVVIYLPLILMFLLFLAFILMSAQSIYLTLVEETNFSFNYQMIGVLDDQYFGFKRTYILEDNIVIEPYVKQQGMDSTTDDLKRVYYKLYDNGSGELIDENYMSNDKIIFPKSSYNNYGLSIELYSISSISELDIVENSLLVLIDDNVIDDYVDVVDFVTNPNSTIENKVAIDFINDNYINSTMLAKMLFPAAWESTIKDYLKLNVDDQVKFIRDGYQELLAKWNVRKELILSTGITEDMIQEIMTIRTPYDEFFIYNELISNYNSLINYSNQKAVEKVEELEIEAENKNIDTESYYNKKSEITSYERIEYLEELLQ